MVVACREPRPPIYHAIRHESGLTDWGLHASDRRGLPGGLGLQERLSLYVTGGDYQGRGLGSTGETESICDRRLSLLIVNYDQSLTSGKSALYY